MRYRKKPMIIEAYVTEEPMDIETLEGTMHASPGDYIITGVDGEWYPCKPDIFEKTYEPADTASSAVDRDALLEEVKELEKCAWYFGLDFDEDEPLRDRLEEASEDFAGSARRIREALGASE